jgi:hypothetical protein
MSEALRHVIALSFIGSAVLFFCPEGGVKRVLRVICTAMLAAEIVSPIQAIDYNVFSAVEARFSSAEAELLQSAGRSGRTLKRVFFEQNCEDYVKGRAGQLGLKVLELSFELQENGEDAWQPVAVTVHAVGAGESAELMSRLIRDDLGIPVERQVWILDEQAGAG